MGFTKLASQIIDRRGITNRKNTQKKWTNEQLTAPSQVNASTGLVGQWRCTPPCIAFWILLRWFMGNIYLFVPLTLHISLLHCMGISYLHSLIAVLVWSALVALCDRAMDPQSVVFNLAQMGAPKAALLNLVWNHVDQIIETTVFLHGWHWRHLLQ